jgi:hypothetical protein
MSLLPLVYAFLSVLAVLVALAGSLFLCAWFPDSRLASFITRDRPGHAPDWLSAEEAARLRAAALSAQRGEPR